MFKNILVPFVFALTVAHTACADTCSGSWSPGPNEISSSCSVYNCFDGANIFGADISCDTGFSEAQCAEKCCSQSNCKGFDYSASDHGMGAGRCCTSYVSRVEGGLTVDHGTYRNCEKNRITCSSATPVSTHPTDSATECWIDVITESQKGKDCFEKTCPPLHTKGGKWCKLHSLQTEKVCCGADCCEPNVGAIVGVVIGVVIGVTLLIVSSCYYGRCGCFRYRRDQLLIAAAAAQPPQQPPQVVYVQQATPPAKVVASV